MTDESRAAGSRAKGSRTKGSRGKGSRAKGSPAKGSRVEESPDTDAPVDAPDNDALDDAPENQAPDNDAPAAAPDEALAGKAAEDEASEDSAAEEVDDSTEEPSTTRSEATDAFWEEVGVEPVRVALPRDVVGFTLRAYRPANQVTTAGGEAPEDDEDDPFAARERARAAEDAARAAEADLLVGSDNPDDQPESERAAGDETTEDETAESGTEDEAAEDPEELSEEELIAAELAEQLAAQEVPVFLSHRGKLLLFATPEALVSFIHSDAEHEFRQLDTWTTLVKRLRPEDVVPTDDDTYELDLVVENLRAGHDAWDPLLLISAGEVARDLGHALRLEPVITALSPGSPLDDLDEALRAVAAGGISGRFARRRLRRIGAQQASLGWRTVIGKISAATDWRD